MMPGTFAYVSAGTATRQVAEGVFGGGAIFSTLFGLSLAVFSAGYVEDSTKAVEEETGLSMDEATSTLLRFPTQTEATPRGVAPASVTTSCIHITECMTIHVTIDPLQSKRNL